MVSPGDPGPLYFHSVSLEGLQLSDPGGNLVPQPVCTSEDGRYHNVSLNVWSRPEDLFLGLHHLRYFQDLLAYRLEYQAKLYNHDVLFWVEQGEEAPVDDLQHFLVKARGEDDHHTMLLMGLDKRTTGIITGTKSRPVKWFCRLGHIVTAIAAFDFGVPSIRGLWSALFEDEYPDWDKLHAAFLTVLPQLQAVADRASRVDSEFREAPDYRDLAAFDTVSNPTKSAVVPQSVFLVIWALQNGSSEILMQTGGTVPDGGKEAGSAKRSVLRARSRGRMLHTPGF